MRWTDETQRFEVSANALLSARRTPADPVTLGLAVRRELLAWYHDASFAERHPGRSSVEAVQRLIEGTSWRCSGNPKSDGADAVIAAIPVGLLYAPDAIVTPALVCSMATHTHHNALQASVMTAWLISCLARGVKLSPSLFMRARNVGRVVVPKGRAARSLTDALAQHAFLCTHDKAAFEPTWVRPGDGGLRSGSALGIAALIALLHAGDPSWENLEVSLSQAAFSGPGAEPVAALTGAILGTAWGAGAISRHLVEHTEQHDHLIDVARALHLHAQALNRGSVDTVQEVDCTGAFSTPPCEPRARFAPLSGESVADVSWDDVA